jgi:hypothetical protein
MARGSSEGRGPVVLVLVILVAAGGWNFVRNTRIENAEVRFYRGYSDTELEELTSVYESEIDQRTAAYRKVADRSIVVQEGALLGERVDEFERVQRISQKRKDMAGKVTDNQISLEQIELEWQKRAANRPVYKMIFRRLISFGSA